MEMKKDKEWLMKETKTLLSRAGLRVPFVVSFYDLIDQLDEPEKVTIPQEAADWIESVRNLSNSMSCLMAHDQIKRFSHELTLWCYETGNNDNLHKLARAWLDGYEVEKEKLYQVIFPTKNTGWKYYYLDCDGGIDMTNHLENVNCHTEYFIRSISDELWTFAAEVEE